MSVNKTHFEDIKMKKMVLKVTIEDEKNKRKALKVVAAVKGVDYVAVDMKEKKITVIGEADPVSVTARLRKNGFGFAELLSVELIKEEKKERDQKDVKKEEKKEQDKKDVKKEEKKAEIPTVVYIQRPYYYYDYDYSYADDENPNACTIC